MFNRALLVLLVLLPSSYPNGAEWSNEVGIEARHFFSGPLNPKQYSNNLSLTFKSEFYHDWQQGDQRLVVTPFVRLDQHDDERSQLDLRELYWRKSFTNTDLYVGVRKLFWGVTESVHLVDIINQSDMVENLDGEDKLGQPMVSLAHTSELGDWEFFLMPWFRKRSFAGVEGRLRTPLVVDQKRARYESGEGEKHLDSALRWSHVISDWDVGLSWFHGTDRTPQLIAATTNGTPILFPYYPQLNQLGLDLQYTYEAWLWKLESVWRRHDNRNSPTLNRSTAAVGGFEYTWYGILSGVSDLGLVLEYQYDNRNGSTAPLSNNDIAVGSRITLNDEADSALLALISTDLDQRTRFISIEASRRLANSLSINLEARFFSNTTPQALLYPLRNDDYLEISLTHYF